MHDPEGSRKRTRDLLPSSTEAQLAAIQEVVAVAERLLIEVWLRGGWAMDFALGRVTREHVDVDWFAWNGDMDRLVDALAAAGWIDLRRHPEDQQRDLRRDDVEIGIATLGRNNAGEVIVGGGAYAGEVWPGGMLDDAVVGEVCGVRAIAISPASQLEIKRMMPIWVPRFARREKDALDIARLRVLLDSPGQTDLGESG